MDHAVMTANTEKHLVHTHTIIHNIMSYIICVHKLCEQGMHQDLGLYTEYHMCVEILTFRGRVS